MSMPNIAAQTLQRQILSGTYLPGEMLPSQRELSDSMGISRASLREALSMLEALGFIRSVPGKGTLVAERQSGRATPPPPQPSAEGEAAPATPPLELAAIFQLRYVMESAAAALAARHITPHATPRLWGIQARFEEALKNLDLVSASHADFEFHQLIAELSGNPGFTQLVRQFESPISHSLRVPFADRERIWAPAVEHRAIAAAISAGDADGARQAMQQHVVNAAARVELRFGLP
ncbi:FadR/GntR family transcriptional regulator [Herbaspirillum sp. WKF16]|jgi:GntR family transcriptional repressor for pyruvate dehydrogenase complex|uniref:FadR/GntR family transcriptional regulator n=1 Tax=Herbaspirillum sp. WKF16 TaxID=3028312 RepID=UPI0023A93A43|nr:FadR/GntR family transcriptional regulator [Herbaspirillum sp. WKF16]WDZ96087.1 FadR/GntR family transcriptional regulator [Herbaspirillum sp. WKF16]